MRHLFNYCAAYPERVLSSSTSPVAGTRLVLPAIARTGAVLSREGDRYYFKRSYINAEIMDVLRVMIELRTGWAPADKTSQNIRLRPIESRAWAVVGITAIYAITPIGKTRTLLQTVHDTTYYLDEPVETVADSLLTYYTKGFSDAQ